MFSFVLAHQIANDDEGHVEYGADEIVNGERDDEHVHVELEMLVAEEHPQHGHVAADHGEQEDNVGDAHQLQSAARDRRVWSARVGGGGV